MKKLFLIFLFLITTFSFAYISPSYSFKFSITADFSNDYPVLIPSYYTSTGFWMNSSVMGSDFTGSFSMSGPNLDSVELNFSKDKFGLNIYKNRIFGGTNDYLGLYKFDIGSDGLMMKFSNLYFFAYNSLNLNYLKYEGNNKLFIFGIRGNKRDYLVEFNIPVFVNLIFEGIYTDYDTFSFEKSVFQLGLTERDWKWGIKYTFGGSEVSLPDFTNVNVSNRHLANLWYNFKNGSIWLNLKSDEDGQNVAGLSEIGLNYDFSLFSFSISKTGFEQIGLTPDNWGSFNISLNYPYDLFGIKGKITYSFGSPAHNTIGTLGEVYYIEFSKNLGPLSLFGKAQRIVGIYEKRNTAYFEIKLPGFKNGEIKLSVGNGDFYNVNTFKKIISLEFNTWW
ncbi:MAG: hypothetical protein PWP54_1438 [Thermosipho sp. (in: thermotogales)]|nr:hypothetical protein [Thermosipho sp. (in: thermotogales)]